MRGEREKGRDQGVTPGCEEGGMAPKPLQATGGHSNLCLTGPIPEAPEPLLILPAGLGKGRAGIEPRESRALSQGQLCRQELGQNLNSTNPTQFLLPRCRGGIRAGISPKAALGFGFSFFISFS